MYIFISLAILVAIFIGLVMYELDQQKKWEEYEANEDERAERESKDDWKKDI